MPRLLTILAGALLLALGAWFTFQAARPVTPTKEVSGEALQKNFPPDVVFARAFWRSPATDDRILHAERWEWSDADGVTRWQAFLEVAPGSALQEWLASNPFSLVSSPDLDSDIQNPPTWFPNNTAHFTIQKAPFGQMVILTAPGGSPVYFTDQGRGFARPAESSKGTRQ
jgi:hypothetical protein